jgi:hypothetical protein
VARYGKLLSAGAALLLLAACERPSAVAPKDQGADARSASSQDRPASYAEDRGGGGGADHRDDPVRLVDGKPMWSASRRGSAEENAQRSFERNGEAFGARDVDDFVRKAHAFVDHPPERVLTVTRFNGDKMFYDPKDNIFAVANKEGAPRTMFKPDQGQAYWDQQKARETQRQTARADRKERTGDDG